MSSAVMAGMLTAVETTPPVSGAIDLLGGLHAGAMHPEVDFDVHVELALGPPRGDGQPFDGGGRIQRHR